MSIKFRFFVSGEKLILKDKYGDVLNLNTFKGICDSSKECLEKIFNKYENLIFKKDISFSDFLDCIIITKIDTEICKNWNIYFPDIKS